MILAAIENAVRPLTQPEMILIGTLLFGALFMYTRYFQRLTTQGPQTRPDLLGLPEMLAGITPFRGESGRSVLAAILRAAPPGLASGRSDVPSEIETFVLRLLAKEPEDRPPSMAAVITAIDGLRGVTALPAR